MPLTPAQRSTAWYFFVVAALFLVQTLLGGATAHYHAEAAASSASTWPQWLPYNLTRTWHLQLALFFVATAYLAAGIFLAPLIAGREPRGSGCCPSCCWALVVVVVGSLAGEAASYKGWLPHDAKPLIGAQGWEYLDLGRVWQILLVGRPGSVVRDPLPRPSSTVGRESRGNLPVPVLLQRPVDPLFYAVGLVNRPQTNFAIADFWRFWVVHLWVEDFLELFTTIMVAYIFVLLGVVSEKTATRVIYFDILLYSVGGVVGTMHHLYFSGTPASTWRWAASSRPRRSSR